MSARNSSTHNNLWSGHQGVLDLVINFVHIDLRIIASHRILQVNDSQEDLLRLTRKLEHITLSIENSRRRDIIHEDEYNNALTTVSKYFEVSLLA